MLPRLAIITTHPIQYNAPVFKLLNERRRIEVKVFYTWEQAQEKVYDVNFKREVKWDIPLLDGYNFTFLKNVAKNPGSHHYNGIDNPSLIKEIEVYKPGAILIFGWNFKSHLKALRYFKGRIPIIFRGDSTLLDDVPGIKSFIRKVFLSWIYSHIDKALYVGERSQAYFKNNALREKQLIFVPHAVDNKRFHQFSMKARINGGYISRKNLGIENDNIVFLFAGKLEPKKNPFLLASAFKRLNSINSHLIFVGNGKLEFDLKQQFSKDKNIHFLDFQNQMSMPFVYALADVFVLPSAGPGESWGLAVNEAMACSKAVLVSDKSGCAVDLVIDGRNGYTFKSQNEDDLIKKMKSLTQIPKTELEQMGRFSYTMIQDWSSENVCKAIENTMCYDA